MAYDEELAHRVRELIGEQPGLSEMRMFGGLAFLLDGNMAVAVSSKGGLMLRHDPERLDELLGRPHTRPMNRLIALVMLATLAAIVVELSDDGVPSTVAWVSLLLAAMPIALVGVRTVPAAVRLGRRSDSVDRQRVLARSVLREHVFCFVSIAALIALQLSCS